MRLRQQPVRRERVEAVGIVSHATVPALDCVLPAPGSAVQLAELRHSGHRATRVHILGFPPRATALPFLDTRGAEPATCGLAFAQDDALFSPRNRVQQLVLGGRRGAAAAARPAAPHQQSRYHGAVPGLTTLASDAAGSREAALLGCLP